MALPALISSARTLLSPALGAVLLTAVLIVVLVWQTLSALRVQRVAEHNILSNYAEIAADTWVRRSSSQIGYRAYYQSLNMLSQLAQRAPAQACAAQARWAQSADPAQVAAARVIDDVLVVDGETRVCGPENSVRMMRHLQVYDRDPSVNKDQALSAFHDFEGVHARSWIYAPLGKGWIAFAVDPTGLAEHFAQLLDAGSLLPRSVGDIEDPKTRLRVLVKDPASTTIYRSDDNLTEPRAAYERDFGDDYGGVLSGYQVRITIPPNLAVRLVQQAPPVLPLEYLLGLALMAVLLGAVALFQLRSERALIAMRTDFVARVSHELRTPLTQISLYADTLVLGRTRSDQDRQHALEVIQREARRLTHLIGNILRFSSQSSSARAAPGAVSLDEALRHAVEAARMLAPDREIVMNSLIDAGINVAVDRDALHLALINLLDNALKYSPKHLPVSVSVHLTGGSISVLINDSGPGIPASQRLQVQQAYFRLERDRQSATPGTGIGLSVVQTIAQRYGGSLAFGDSSTGGTQARLQLPIATPP